MAELTVPTLDFSTIGNLGQVYKQAQADQVRQQTLAQLGQGGTIDPQALVKAGIGINDLGLANLGIGMQNHNDTLAHQTVEDRRASTNDAFSHDIQTKQLAISQQNSDRQNEGVPEKAADRAKAAAQYGITPDMPAFRTFVLTGALPADNTPAGFTKQPDGSVAPMPGGPQDPAYLAAKVKAEAAAKGDVPTVMGSGSSIVIPNTVAKDGPIFTNRAPVTTLDPGVVNDMADQYLAGDRTVMQNLGRGAQGAENIIKLRTAISERAKEAGLDPKGIVDNFNEQAGALAGQRAVGTRAANISLAANEANNMIPIALDASDKVPRTQYMPWNQMVQSVQKGTSSPELASFVAATNSLVNSYVRAVSPTGVPTDSMRQHAYDMLNQAQGPEAYKAVVATMQKEMQAALSAPSQVKKELRGGGAAAPTGAPAPSPVPAAAPPPPPQIGQMVGGFRYKGGNPADPASWVQQAAPVAPVGTPQQ